MRQSTEIIKNNKNSKKINMGFNKVWDSDN